MSNFYLDVIKDRLYCDETAGLPRRSAQTTMYTILSALVRILAPILAFTTEEIWAAMPHGKNADRESVLYNQMPHSNADIMLTQEREDFWDKLLRLRTDVNKALELARAEKIIGKPLDAEITLYIQPSAAADFKELPPEDLKTLFIVSAVTIVEGTGSGFNGTEFPGVTVSVTPSDAPKCSRCWVHDENIGNDTEHPELCPRCLDVVTKGR
jgi:isoleucyl-tRNA synthetase